MKTIQGDVGGIINATDNIACIGMLYDAWGNVTYDYNEELDSLGMLEALNIASINNVTYRGYFYDFETGLYYLQSRYYDPETGRFINADDTAYIGYDSSSLTTNIFAYCANNPVNRVDYSGKASFGYLAYSLAVKYKQAYNNSLCAQLFTYGLIKSPVAFSKNFRSLLRYRLRHSTAIQNRLNYLIGRVQRRSLKKGSEAFEINFYEYRKNFSDIDLFLSVGGGCIINFKIEYLNKKNKKGYKIYKVTLTMNNDSFDFDEYWTNKTRHDKNAVVTILNNVGYRLQKAGIFRKFTWSFKVIYEGSFIPLN